jgi:lysophospholipase L1-like esterase
MKFNKKQYLGLVMAILSFVMMAFNMEDKRKQVVCFGDSITFGASVNGRSWVSFLKENHLAIDFVNAGRSGRKTSDKLELLPVLNKYPSADKYLIFLGVNDLKDGNDVMVNTCVDNMKWMILEIRKVNPEAKIIVLAPCDINLKTMNEINVKKKYNENTKSALYLLSKKYKTLAKQEKTEFISLLHAVSAPNYADGLHPNLKGQEEISVKVWKAIK